jgi:hypothetical protein
MSFQVRYCEPCGKAWPVAEGWECPNCGEKRGCRDAITVIHNLHHALAAALGAKPKETK